MTATGKPHEKSAQAYWRAKQKACAKDVNHGTAVLKVFFTEFLYCIGSIFSLYAHIHPLML